MEFPLAFHLIRDSKIVAYGAKFPSGKCAVNWTGQHSSVVVWDSLASLKAVNGHANTKIVFQKIMICESDENYDSDDNYFSGPKSA